jgi:hypothetical protein
MSMKESSLAKAWDTDLQKGLTGLLHGQFQSCRSPLALTTVP